MLWNFLCFGFMDLSWVYRSSCGRSVPRYWRVCRIVKIWLRCFCYRKVQILNDHEKCVCLKHVLWWVYKSLFTHHHPLNIYLLALTSKAEISVRVNWKEKIKFVGIFFSNTAYLKPQPLVISWSLMKRETFWSLFFCVRRMTMYCFTLDSMLSKIINRATTFLLLIQSETQKTSISLSAQKVWYN